MYQNTMTNKQRALPSVKAQTLAALIAAAAAVALPQVFHVVGAAAGLGAGLGESFLPMYLPIMLVGFLAGPYAGASAAIVAPLCSYGLTAMPAASMLPFILIELVAIGVGAGLLRKGRFPAVLKVLAVQVIGKLVRLSAVLVAVYALGNEAVSVAAWGNAIVAGLPGVILQLVLVPLILYALESRQRHDV